MKIITAEISSSEYIAHFRDADKFIHYCKECDNYGKSWLCPPFEYDVEARLTSWSKVLLAGTVIPVEAHTPISKAMTVLHPARVELSEYLLDAEVRHNGMALGFSGQCLYCRKCSRLSNMPCIHPDKARPSLEAYGFDVEATANKLLGIKLSWGHDGFLPDNLSLIGAVFMP